MTKKLLLTFALLLTAVTGAFADDNGSCGDVSYSYVESTNTLTISGTGAMADYDYSKQPWYSYAGDIKTVVIGAGVTTIGKNAFNECSGLTSITIPANVTSIGERAFAVCYNLATVSFAVGSQLTTIGDYAFTSTGLTSIEIPASVTSIGERAFNHCSNLATISFAEGSQLTRIGDGAFHSCSGLTSIVIPASVTSISANAFGYCSKLETMTVEDGNAVYDSRNGCNAIIEKLTNTLIIGCKNSTIPDGVTTIGKWAFSDCEGLTSIEIPASVTTIAGYAFASTGLTSIEIPASVTTIGGFAFSGCVGLTTVSFAAGSQLETIGGYAFASTGLTSIEIPASVTTIGEFAFSNCQTLATVSFAAGSQLETIGGNAFQGCSGLTSITIPASVTSIGDIAFEFCSNLATVTVYAPSCILGEDAFEFCPELTIYVFSDLVEYYKSAWNAYAGKITAMEMDTPHGNCGENVRWVLTGESTNYTLTITGTGAMADYDYSKQPWYSYAGDIKTVVIGAGVTTIGKNAFNECSGLTSITIPANVTSIGRSAFNKCSGLASVSFAAGSQLATIGIYAFASTGLTSIEIPASVTSIGEYAFYSCSDLTSITIPASVTSISVEAFSGCSNLATMTVEDGNAVYDSRNGCNAIIEKLTNTLIIGCKNSTIPVGVTTIGDNAFNFSGLTSITIPASVTTIGVCAFQGCTGLTSITISAGVTTIGGYAFSGCDGLTSITIPASVTSIGDWAFVGCKTLATVTVYAPSCTLGIDAFMGCNKLTYIYVFSDFVNDYKDATNWSNYKDIITDIPNPNGNCGENVRWVLTGESTNYTLTITGTGAMADYEGPSNQPWNSNAGNIKTVVIGANVTTIGKNAFNFSGLTSITIPASVTSISKYAFGGCSKLETMTVEDGNETYDSRNGCNAIIEKLTNTLIIGCKNSTIPVGVTTIGDSAFSNCEGLTSITIPASVTSIGDNAFSNCQALATVTVYAPSCTLGIDAFENCPALTIYVFRDLVDDYKDADNWSNYKDRITEMLTPNGNCGENVRWVLTGESPNYTLTISGTGAIQDAVWGSMPWNSYKSSITTLIIEDGVTSIGKQAFDGCSSLNSVTIPASVTTIGADAFYGCNSLTSIEIPSGVTSIGNFAFYGCIGLTTIEIPASVTSIGINPFYGCSGLESISVASGNTKYDSRNKCNAIIEKETNKLIVGCKNSVIPDDVTAIGESAFNGCTGLTSIEIPSGVTTIGNFAFDGCTDLTSIEIPASVTSIGINAFCGCSGLESISVAEGNPTYDSRNNCNALIETKTNTLILGCKNTVIPGNPNGVTTIGTQAFDGCTGLTTIEIPASVTTIGTQAFDGCTSLTSIEIPASVTTIGGYAFWACTGLESISVASGNAKYHSGGNCLIETESHTLILGCKNSVIPDDVTTIGEFAFYDCIGLTTIEIPASVTSIGNYALQNCTSLTSIEIPASVTSIGEFAFDGCTSLESIEIPASVTSIGGGAFKGCISLTSIEIPASVTSIGGGAFEDCTGLNSVTICAPQLGEHNEYSKAFVGNASDRKIYVFENCMDYYKAQAWSVDYPGMGFYEKDILPITDISLKGNDDNSSLIAAASGNAIDPLNVTLKGRTLYKDGDWNTLCLPFSVTVGSGVMADATAMTLNGSESGFDASTGVLTLNFVGVTSGNTIAAGTPFIVKWQKPDGYVAYNPATPEAECSDIVSPVFEGVTVSNAATTQTFGNGSFKGTYASITYEEENKSILFVGGENSLYWPTAGFSIGAQRAYFELNDGEMARNIVLNFEGENATGISLTPDPSIPSEARPPVAFPTGEGRSAAYYTLDGRKLAGKPSAPGIYVKDGRKVAIKREK